MKISAIRNNNQRCSTYQCTPCGKVIALSMRCFLNREPPLLHAFRILLLSGMMDSNCCLAIKTPVGKATKRSNMCTVIKFCDTWIVWAVFRHCWGCLYPKTGAVIWDFVVLESVKYMIYVLGPSSCRHYKSQQCVVVDCASSKILFQAYVRHLGFQCAESIGCISSKNPPGIAPSRERRYLFCCC